MANKIVFLNQKLHQSISSDADIAFPNENLYSKKIWILNEYKKQNGELFLSQDDSEASEKNLDSSKITNSLKEKIKYHNDKFLNKVSLSQIKRVYERGIEAFCSQRPNTIKEEWAMARANMFLKMMRGGEVKESYRLADQDIGKTSSSYQIQAGEIIVFSSKEDSIDFIEDIDEEFFEDIFQKNATNVSYSINKSFENDEYIVDLIKNIEYKDPFDYFAKVDIEQETGNEELDIILASFVDSDFDFDVIKDFIDDDIDSNNPHEKFIGSSIISFSKTNEDKISEVYKKYHDTVNMGYNALETWSKNPCSRSASLSRSPIARNLNLLSKKKQDWTMADVRSANRTISFVSRMKGAEQGEKVKGPDGESCPSKRDISLKNWAYNP